MARKAKAGPKTPVTLSEDEVALFRAAVADATPLVVERVEHDIAPPPAIPRQHHLDEAAALTESLHGPPLLDLFLEGGDEAAWLRPGLARNVLRDLRRGRWAVQDHLDLHGLTREEARSTAGEFITACSSSGRHCVRIVHGKGLRSPGREPVLKRLVLGWLTQKREVLAFCQAPPNDGGAGAVLVLLRHCKRAQRTD